MKVSEQIAIMKAYEDGKTIEQKRCDETKWESIDYVENYPFDFVLNDYRIKQVPKYRPFQTIEEAFNEAKKHGFWIRNKNDRSLLFIDLFYNEKDGSAAICDCPADEILDNYVWIDDNSPCGVKIE